jgi:hypothetical protein
MRSASRPLDDAAGAALAAPARGFIERHALASALALSGGFCGLVALRLELLLGRYDTLAYILQDPSGRLVRLRLVVMAAGAVFGLLALASLRSARLAVALCGAALLSGGLLASPAAKAWFAAERGLEESLVYRLRGLADIGIVGGVFLIFLALLPRILAVPAGALETRLSMSVRQGVERWLSLPAAVRGIAVGALALFAALAVGMLVLAGFPNSSDESSYLTQARIFASGRLWVPAPAHPEFFRARSMVLDPEAGRFFAKAFPGYAAVLSLGVLAGAPWLLNPLLSALALVLAGWIGGRLLGPAGEPAMVGTILLTPFFLLNSASYFSHPATLFCITLFLAAVVNLEAGAGGGWAGVAGVAAAIALSMRPAAAAALTLPFLIWMGARWVRGRRWARLAALLLPVGVVLAVLGAWNRILYGSALRTGYAVADPGDIRFGLGADNLAATGWWLLKLLFWTVPGSLAGLYFFGRGRSPRSLFREDPIPALCGVSLLLLAAGHLLFQNKASNEYGPRYYYDGFTYLALLMAAGWMRSPGVLSRRLPRQKAARGVGLVLGCGAALALIGSVPLAMAHYRDKVAHNSDLYAAVQRAGLSSALVFLETGSGRMPPGDLLRNPLDFRTGVVYARDLGPEADRRLAGLYQDRPAVVYAYDPYTRTSTLRPLAKEGAP